MENKIFPYIHNTWVTSNPLSRSSAYPAPSALMPSASWGCQPLSMPCRVFLKFPFTDEYLWKLTGVIEPVNTRRRHKPSACSYWEYLLFSSTSLCKLVYVRVLYEKNQHWKKKKPNQMVCILWTKHAQLISLFLFKIKTLKIKQKEHIIWL